MISLISCPEFALSQDAIKNLRTIMEHMVEHDLEASKLVLVVDGLTIKWENGFNATHIVEITCLNTGLVCGKAIKTDDKWIKLWCINDPSLIQKPDLASDFWLHLSLDESLEYVRHFIWANHNI